MKYRHHLGVLFSPRSRLKLLLAILGSVIVAVAEAMAIILVVPLMQVLSGADPSTGTLGMIGRTTGVESAEGLRNLLLGAVVAGFVLKDVATMVFRWWMLGFINRAQADTSVTLLDYYLRLPYLDFQRTSSTEKFRIVGTAVGFAYGRFVLGGVSAVTEGVTIVAIAAALLVTATIPTLGMIVYFGAAALAFAWFFKPHVQRATENALEASERGLRASFHAVFGIKEIKLRVAYDRFVKIFRREVYRSARAAQISAYLGELPKYILEILFVVGIAIAVALASASGAGGGLMAVLALLAAGSFRVLPSITRLVASINGMQGGAVALEQVTRLLWDARQNVWLDRSKAPAVPLSFSQGLVIRNVCFRYGEDLPQVLNDINLTIPHGTSVAFVGASGAGKSTLVDIVLGFLTPTSGRLEVDGQVLSSMNLKSWQRTAAMVPQAVYLIDGTLRENIAFDQDVEDIDEERLRRAVELAQLDDLVAGLPAGLDEQVGEQGGRLSGGQKQRIGIARALYREPAFLVLDEATSALDNETERRITQTIEALRGEVTVVLVAHRLSTVKNADQLAYFEDGRIVGLGSFEEVRASSPGFAHMVALGSLEASNDGKGPAAGRPSAEGESPGGEIFSGAAFE